VNDMGGRRGVDPPVKLPNNLLQQTAASLSVSQGILPSRPPLLSFGVRPLEVRAPWICICHAVPGATR
jgi:hypothetical protein